MDTHSTDSVFQKVISLLRKGLNDEEITLQLRELGAPDHLHQNLLQEAKNIRLTKKRKTGFACCGIGVTLLIVGCMCTILLFSNGNDIKFAMYGLTTIGVVFTLKGLVDLMGW